MPRQIDLIPGNLTLTNNPNVQLSVTAGQITSLFSNLAEMSLQAIEFAIKEFITLFDQVTGLDLSALADLLSGLDFSSPEAFVSSLITVLISLPETLIQLLESLVTQLTSPAGVDSLVSMLESLVATLISPSGLSTLTSLVTSIITLLLDLPELLLSLAGGLLGGGDILGGLIGAFTGTFLGAGANGASGTGGTITDLIQSITSIPAAFLTGTLGAGLISHTGVGGVSNQTPQLLTNPNFDTATSILGHGSWMWDGTQGPPGTTTSIFATAAGAPIEILSNLIAVAPGQSLAISGNTKWSGFTGGANSIALTVAKFDPTNLLTGYDTIGSVASPGSSGGWTTLSGTYTIPAGVAGIQLRPLIASTAAAGQVWFGKTSVKQTGTTLFGAGIPLLDASKIGSGTFPFTMTGVQSLMDTMFQTLTGATTTNNLLSDISSALQNIPFTNVGGYGGPSNIGGTDQATWDNLISGLVGSVGTGAGLADLFNVSNQVSSNAALGGMGWSILGIRNNKSLKTGFLPSSQSNISLDKLALNATMPTVPITQSTALTNYERIGESIDIGAVSWQGAGTTNITAAFVNLYRMDPTSGVNTLVHQSANLVGSLSATMAPVIYSLPAPVHFDPADIFGMEVAVQGSGTHNIAGSVSSLPAQAVFPRQWSSVRNSGTTGPPSTFTPTYSNNVGFIEYAVSAGTLSLPHNPSTAMYATPGTQNVPIASWANFVDVVAVGAGGGGAYGAFGTNGDGASAGQWATDTWVRGTDFTGTASVNVTISAGGTGGTASTNGSAGGTATTSIPGSTVTATGGAGIGSISGHATGASPGNQTYLGQLYVGGVAQNTLGAAGTTPGGGGAGGSGFGGNGGGGGPAGVWLVFRQT